jgi:hypothetical protein
VSQPTITLDQLVKRGAETVARKLNHGQAWDRGLGAVVEEFIDRTVPNDPVPTTPIGLLDRLGLLPPDRRRKAKGAPDASR